MNATVFISTTGNGLARAEGRADGGWLVESLLESQKVSSLAADPHNPGVVYAGTQGNGLLRSDDSGKTWRPAGMSGYIVKSIAVSPAEPDLIYAGTKPPLIFVSRDGGKNWTELESFRRMRRWWWLQPAELPPITYIQSIALSPTNPEVIVAGLEACGVFRSLDSGRTWTGHMKGSVRDCHTMTFHAMNGDWVYEAGGTGAGVSFSRDAGATWTQPETGLDRRYGWTCAADPARPEVWYASLSPLGRFPNMAPLAHVDGEANAHIFRRTGDAPWEKLGGGLPQPLNYMAYALLTDPTAPGHLYAGLSNGDVWHTADYGDTWQQLPFNLGGIHRSLIML